MATSLWGKIHYHALFAGELRQEPADAAGLLTTPHTWKPAILRLLSPCHARLRRTSANTDCTRSLTTLLRKAGFAMLRRGRSKSILTIALPCFSHLAKTAPGPLQSSTQRRQWSHPLIPAIRRPWRR